MTPTEEQEAIFAATKLSSDSLMIDAYAGVGKTTTLAMTAPGIRVPALALAFNRSIKDELGKRFPPNFSVMSMNGLGMKALARGNPQLSLKLDDKKLGKIITEQAKQQKITLDEDQWNTIRQMVRQAMLDGLVPGNAGVSPLMSDTPEAWKELADDLWVAEDESEFLMEFAREVLIENNRLVSDAGIISFDDQVYYSVCVSGKFPLFPVLFVDEAQDLNGLNHAMLAKCLRPDGRLVACGDARQSIYAFRGAHSDSFGRIKGLRTQWQTLPLATTFRCPKIVVERQRFHAPGFRAAETAPTGKFAELALPSEEDLLPNWGWREIVNAKQTPNDSIAILCRNNAPLLELAFKLLRQRIPIIMAGRDIGQGLIALSKKIFPEEATKDQMMGMLEDWAITERSKATLLGQDEKLAGIEDRAESLKAVMTYAEVESPSSLRKTLQGLFARESGAATLSSIHRAKGLEWDVVVHLDPWRIPSKWAKEQSKLGNDGPMKQELNLRYVAETRTKHTLLHANLKEFF